MMFDQTARLLLRGSMVGAFVLLSACQSTQQASKPASEPQTIRDSFLLSNLNNALKTAPDEFSVITKRPLEMPGDFAALPVPEPGKPSPRDLDPIADARAALSLQPVPAATGRTPVPVGPSASEAAILSAIGPVDPTIRATLQAEQAAYDAEQDIYVLDRVLPILRDARGAAVPDALDPEAERLRLLEAGVLSPSSGAVATVPAATPLPVLQPTVVPSPAPVAAPAPVLTVPTTTPATNGAADLIYLPG